MIAIGYFDGIERKGLLVWTEDDDGHRHAIGGFDPGDVAAAVEPVTVVTRDDEEYTLSGWVHPDNILS